MGIQLRSERRVKQQAWEKFTVLWRVPVRFVAKRQRWPSRRRRRFQRDAPTRDSCTTEDLSTSSLDSARREDQTPTPPKERARLGQSKTRFIISGFSTVGIMWYNPTVAMFTF